REKGSYNKRQNGDQKVRSSNSPPPGMAMVFIIRGKETQGDRKEKSLLWAKGLSRHINFSRCLASNYFMRRSGSIFAPEVMNFFDRIKQELNLHHRIYRHILDKTLVDGSSPLVPIHTYRIDIGGFPQVFLCRTQ